MAHPSRSLKRFLVSLARAEKRFLSETRFKRFAPDKPASYTGCSRGVTELHATVDQEIAHGYQYCQGLIFAQCAWLQLEEKAAAGNWVTEAGSGDACKHGYNEDPLGGDGTVYNRTWDWCSNPGQQGWRWWRAYERGEYWEGVPGETGAKYGTAQLVHRGCIGA